MGARRLDQGFDRPRVCVGLTNAADPLVGVNPYHYIVLCAATRRRVYIGDQQDETFDVGDFHALSLSVQICDLRVHRISVSPQQRRPPGHIEAITRSQVKGAMPLADLMASQTVVPCRASDHLKGVVAVHPEFTHSVNGVEAVG